MMKMKRVLCVWLCLMLLAGSMPVLSEEIIMLEELPATFVSQESADTSDAQEPEETEMPEEMIQVADVEAVIEPSPEVPDEPSAEPDTAIIPETTTEATAETLPEAGMEPTEEAVFSAEEQMEEAVSKWMVALTESSFSSEFDKAFWLYERMIEKIVPGDADTAYAAIVENSANARGYARAFEALLAAAGINGITVSESWNVACLDGEWTHIDVYADDVNGSIGHHFGLTDAAMSVDHVWVDELPACTGTNNNCYVRRDGYRLVASLEDFKQVLADAAAKKDVEIKVYNAAALNMQDEIAAIEPEGVSVHIDENGCFAVLALKYGDVPKVPASQIIAPYEKLTIGVGEKVFVGDWKLLPENAEDSVSYSTDSTRIASVNAEGIVTGKRAGTTKLHFKAAGGAKCAISIMVKKAPGSVSITADRKALGVGEELQLTAKLPSGTAGAVKFSTEDAAVEVSESGLVKALQPGSATITATTYNNKKKTVTIEVKAAPKAVIPSMEDVMICEGDNWTLGYSFDEGSEGAVKFISSDEEIISVDANGNISALQQGTAEVSIIAYNDGWNDTPVRGSCSINVASAPVGMELAAPRSTIGVGEKLQLVPEIDPSGVQCSIKYKSSNTRYATVNADGIVTGKKAGSATITATAYNGVKDTFKVKIVKAPGSVSISADRKVLGVGEELQLTAKLPSGTAGVVKFTTEDAAVEVSESGLIKALQPGSATITATTYNKKKKSITLEVKAAPTAVIPAMDSVSIAEGDKWTLAYSLSEESAGAVKFISSDEEILSVDANGKISALKQGVAEVSIIAYNDGWNDTPVRGSCSVNVASAPVGMDLTALRGTIGVGEKLQLVPEIDPPGVQCSIKYKSSNTRYATVNADGIVTGKKAGTATITATAYNGIKATFKVKVIKAPGSVSISADRKVLGVGEELQLNAKLPKGTAGAVEFSTEDACVVVNKSGMVKAVQPGIATITAVTYNNKKKSITIEVKEAPAAVLPATESVSICEGDNWTLDYSLSEGSAGAVEFISSNEQILTVDPNGRISAIKQGEAEVNIIAYNDGWNDMPVRGTCRIQVTPAPSQVKLTANVSTIGVGEKLQLVPEIDQEGTCCSVKYKSGSARYATVNADGIVTGKREGTATITATTYNGLKATFKVKVVKAPGSVSITADRKILGIGEEMQLKAKLPKGAAGAVKFSTEDSAVSVTEGGYVKAVSVGTATVTAKTYNGKKKNIELTVCPGPDSILLSVNNAVMGIGDQMTVTAALSEGSVGTYSFISENEDIAQIDPVTGVITAIGEGEVSIIARAHNGVEDKLALRVIPAPVKLGLKTVAADENGRYEITLKRGERFAIELDAGEYTHLTNFYTCDQQDIASVSAQGEITAHYKSGQAVITVECYNGVYLPIYLTVQRWPADYPVQAIMHAMGAVDGQVYSNSLEAFQTNYAKGHRLFEVDFSYTSDDQIVLWHGWEKNQINDSVKLGYVPTEAQFKEMKVFNKYTSLTYKDLLELMDAYPDASFVFDSKEKTESAVRKQYKTIVSVAKKMGKAHVLDRVVVMIYNKPMYDIIRKIHPFRRYVYMMYKEFKEPPTVEQLKSVAAFCAQKNIDVISMWDYWWQEDFIDIVREYKLDVNLHTINSSSDAKKYISQGVSLITTDFLSPNGS